MSASIAASLSLRTAGVGHCEEIEVGLVGGGEQQDEGYCDQMNEEMKKQREILSAWAEEFALARGVSNNWHRQEYSTARRIASTGVGCDDHPRPGICCA